MLSLFLSGPHPLPGPCGEAQSVQRNPCYRPAPAPSHQSWCLPASLLCKMRRTEPGEERTSPEALDGYQTQNRGAVRLLPASFRRKSASSRGQSSGRCPAERVWDCRQRVLVALSPLLHPTDAAPRWGGSRLCQFRWGRSCTPWWKLNGPGVFPCPLAATMGPPSWAGPVWGPAQDSGT